jgi:signal transduction histidine kinase
MTPLRSVSIRIKLALLAASIVGLVVMGQTLQALVHEAVRIQEEIAMEARLVLVSLAGGVGALWTGGRAPDLEPFAKRFGNKLEVRSLTLLSPTGEVVTHYGALPTSDQIRMVTRLRLRAVPQTLWALGTKPLELLIATPILRGDRARGYLMCGVTSGEAEQRLREIVAKFLIEGFWWMSIGAGLTLWATHRLIRPLVRLADDLLHIGSGNYRLPPEGRAEGEVGFVQDRLVELSDMLAGERKQVRDLTERLHHQITVISAGLEARAAELSAVLDSVRDAVLVVREDGHVVRVNQPGQSFFGDTASTPLWNRVVDSDALRKTIEHACAKQSPALLHTEIPVDGKNAARPVRIRVAPLQSKKNEMNALVVVAEDLSESRTLTENMMRSERLSSMAALTAGMAHQLGNHLNAIKGYAALLSRQLQDAEQSVVSDLSSIAREVRAAGSLLERTQALTRTHRPARLEFTLDELLEDVREMAAFAASSHSVEISVELLDKEVSMRGDPGLLGEALFNLVMNGIQAMPNGGRLRLRAWKSGRCGMISIEDEGEGIAEEAYGHIFDPFFTTKPSGEGTGLGLAIADRIIELHGGEITVTSEKGSGSTFTVLLPLHHEFITDPSSVASSADRGKRRSHG